jgi:aryl-alcohol dehydrogenase-like predicted oxidoreductase
LGRTELNVSAIALGTWAFGGDWGRFDNAEAKAVVWHALELGVTLFDTAQGYGFGVSERLLGDALWGRVRRDEVVVATKGGLRMQGDTLVRDSSASWLREGVESSLRNLATEYIDLYQLHWPDPATPIEETSGALSELVREGKIRHAGVSNFDARQMDELARHGPVETLQPPYHMFRRQIEAVRAPQDPRLTPETEYNQRPSQPLRRSEPSGRNCRELRLTLSAIGLHGHGHARSRRRRSSRHV